MSEELRLDGPCRECGGVGPVVIGDMGEPRIVHADDETIVFVPSFSLWPQPEDTRTADPGGRLFAAVRRVIVDGYDAPGVHAELHAAFYEARDTRTADPGGLRAALVKGQHDAEREYHRAKGSTKEEYYHNGRMTAYMDAVEAYDLAAITPEATAPQGFLVPEMPVDDLPGYWRVRSVVEVTPFGDFEAIATDGNRIMRATGPTMAEAIAALPFLLTPEATAPDARE
jgi:hypothetical protein